MNYRDILAIEHGNRARRVTVGEVLESLAAGKTIEEILDDFPFLTHDLIQKCVDYDEAHKKALERFPKLGNKLRYRGNPLHYNLTMIARAKRNLRKGEIYTIQSLELGRSWCIVTLEETGKAEYELAFFDIFSESEQRFKHPAEY